MHWDELRWTSISDVSIKSDLWISGKFDNDFAIVCQTH